MVQVFRFDLSREGRGIVTDQRHRALQAENQSLREQVETLRALVAMAPIRIAELEARIAEFEARKTPPPAFVKANVPAQREPRSPRRQRAPGHNQARRR